MRKWLIGLFLLLVLLVGFLPKIASTSLGKSIFIRVLEQKSQMHVEINSLKLSWFGPQIFQGVKFQKEAVNGFFEELRIRAPFWTFSGPFQLKNGEIAYQGGKVEKLEGQIEGNDFTLTGITLQGHISLKGMITEHGMQLSEPLIARIRLTPEMSALLLKDANPLFVTGISAENPVTLRIEPTDFFFPFPYSLEKLKVGKAILDLGKVRSQNGESLRTIIALLKAGSLPNASVMNIWFTPVSFQIDRGILRAGRLDALLADSIHICTWGNIDLLKDRLDMTLGLPADTLKKAFGIKNLPDNYVMKVGVQGTTGSPIIDKTAAAAKIAALIATSQIPKKGILGGLSDLFSKKEEADVPKANRPFPWESR